MAAFDPDSDELPKLSDLKSIHGAPQHAAWFWGEDDELGRLNMLTPRRIAKASKLVHTGETVSLNLSAQLPDPPIFRREPFKHSIKQLNDWAYDDLYSMNTQSGSQWDGFRHVGFPHKESYVWYNNTTREQILNSSRNGVHAWAKRGIVGRGVLIDFYSFSKKSYDPFTGRSITAQEVRACASAQNIKFEYGDILIIRTGWSEAYKLLDQKGREEVGSRIFAGLARGQEMLELLHDNYFSAVASDAPALESWPTKDKETLHSFLLPRWGVPIGEMWDLDPLAELCKENNRYEFFLTSSPANVPGGVASHPNAIAIF